MASSEGFQILNRASGVRLSRRSFLAGALATAGAAGLGVVGCGGEEEEETTQPIETIDVEDEVMAPVENPVQNKVAEWSYVSAKAYADPFNEIEMDVVFSNSNGTWRVPAFWSGGDQWRVRFAPPAQGRYSFKTECSDTANVGLHGQEGECEAVGYSGDNPLLAHGPLRVSKNRRYFEHADGTPFFWLGDTWWMGLCQRLRWPEDFQLLTADRVEKGFSVILLVAGLCPDMAAFDERGANEAGFPWEKDFARINPAYFDEADQRLQWLVHWGLVPCILGCWGYYLPWMGIERMKKHWRYIIARWGAYPVVWCLAGEAAMPYYLSKTAKRDRADQISGWTEVGRYIRETDPYHRPLSIHSEFATSSRDQVLDDSILDFSMPQANHFGHVGIPSTISLVTQERERQPIMPVLIGEVNYEGTMHGTGDEVQRLGFWGCVLSGTAGHTYGANGIWQVNTPEQPFGPSPHGGTWGNQPWEEAYRWPGSGQLGLGKCLLERYEWWRFEPHQEWIQPSASPNDYFASYAAGIPGEVRVIYSYWPNLPWIPEDKRMKVNSIEPGVQYKAFFFDPRNGDEYPIGLTDATDDGTWPVPMHPTMQDWLLVLERA